jgi:hypothetical protein
MMYLDMVLMLLLARVLLLLLLIGCQLADGQLMVASVHSRQQC